MALSRRPVLIFLAILTILAIIKFRLEYKLVTSTFPNSWEQEVEADCAIALTGGSGRVREALDLLYRGSFKKLIMSGVHHKAEWREILPSQTFFGGLKADDVVLERRSTTTYGNATQSLPLVEALHCRSIALVTSHLHMNRAFKTFRAVFPVDFPIYSYSVVSGELNSSFVDASFETIKSLFSSTWAY